MNILVTGGAGYIGSHTTLKLIEQGHSVTVLDNLENGFQDTLDTVKKEVGEFDFLKLDLRNKSELSKGLQGKAFDAVIHFAAYIEVGVSTQKPEIFFENNVNGTQNLYQVLIENEICRNIIFSSSAAVYGTPNQTPIPETAELNPDSPYGESKHVSERMLRSYCMFRNLNAVALRYFNPCGSYKGIIGERHQPESHVVPRLLKAFLDDSFEFGVYGTNYNTPDGTAIRDYIHVLDLVDAHIACINYLDKTQGFTTLNVGTGQGSSVLQLIQTAEEVVGRKLKYSQKDRRIGDPDQLVADPQKIKTELGWQAKYNLHDMLESAWLWEQKRAKMTS